MVRVQLYLPPILYKTIKIQAKKKDMTFAGYVRNFLETEVAINDSKKTAEQKCPLLKFSGKYHWGGMTNEQIDEALMDIYESKNIR